MHKVFIPFLRLFVAYFYLFFCFAFHPLFLTEEKKKKKIEILSYIKSILSDF